MLGLALPGDSNYMALFTTNFTPSATGTYQFRTQNVDNVGALWLDLNQNGIFEALTQKKTFL